MRFFLCLILALNVTALAVDRPTGFIGIQWGASPEEAKRVMQKRPGVRFPEESEDYQVVLTGGTFAGQPVAKWVLDFPERKFASAAVTLKTEGNANTTFRELRTHLNEKYGPATTSKSLSPPKGTQLAPYGGERTVPLGSVSTWRFPPQMKEKTSIAVVAELSGPNGKATTEESQLSVTIKYVNETLAGTVVTDGAAGTKPTAAPVKKEDL